MAIAFSVYAILGVLFYRLTGTLAGSDFTSGGWGFRLLDTTLVVLLWPVIGLSRFLDRIV